MSFQSQSFNREPVPAVLLIAQSVGITASVFLLGINTALSLTALPAVKQAPAPLAAQQWYTVHTVGRFYAGPIAILSGIATGVVAYYQPSSSLSFKLNVAASILVPGIIPFTIAFFTPTNNKLIERKDKLACAPVESEATKAGVAEAETTHALIDKWSSLNYARAVVNAVGALCTIMAALDRGDVPS